MSDTASELHSMVLNIANELEAAASGSLYDVDGNFEIIDDIDEWKEAEYAKKVEEFKGKHPESEFRKEDVEAGCMADCYDSYQEWMEDEIGTADDVDEPDEVSLSEYLEKQSLGDVRFEVDSSKQLLGGKVLFTYGGPNIWVHDDQVCGYWGSETVEMSLDSDTRSALFSWFEDQWDVISG